MMKNMILLEIYTAITTNPKILTPEFINGLITTVLPKSDSEDDNSKVKEAINQLYQNFPEVRDQIKALMRKSFDDAEPETTPGYETVTNNYPDIKKLELSLKKRIDKDSNTSNTDAKN